MLSLLIGGLVSTGLCAGIAKLCGIDNDTPHDSTMDIFDNPFQP